MSNKYPEGCAGLELERLNKMHICVNSGFLQNNLTLCVVLPLLYQEKYELRN